MRNYAILTDTSFDVYNSDLIKNPDLKIIPLIINLPNNKNLKIDSNLTNKKFYEKLKSEQLKTSQTPIGIMKETLDKILETYKKIIFVTISKKISNQYQSAIVLSKQKKYKNKVIVIDTIAVDILQEIIIKEIFKFLDSEENFEKYNEIQSLVKKINKKFKFIFIPNTLKYLKNGGRIKNSIQKLVNILKIKVVLEFKKGEIEKYAIIRSYKKLNDILIKFKNKYNPKTIYISINEFENKELKKSILDSIKKIEFEKIEYKNLSKVITVHTGPSTIGIGFLYE